MFTNKFEYEAAVQAKANEIARHEATLTSLDPERSRDRKAGILGRITDLIQTATDDIDQYYMEWADVCARGIIARYGMERYEELMNHNCPVGIVHNDPDLHDWIWNSKEVL
jgi:hypothetical protein